jgi:hypothetical protein
MLAVIKLGNPMRHYTMMKLRIATGLGLVLFMATMIGGAVRVSHAQDDQGGVTLADLAGKFAARGSGSLTLCFNAGHTALQDCATAPIVQPFNFARIEQETRDAAGNSCGFPIVTSAPVSGTKFPAGVSTATIVGTTTSFDPTTGSGTISLKGYHGGTCNGAVFDSTGATQTNTAKFSFLVSDSGNRIEAISTSASYVTTAFSVAGSVQGLVLSETFIRQGTQN